MRRRPRPLRRVRHDLGQRVRFGWWGHVGWWQHVRPRSVRPALLGRRLVSKALALQLVGAPGRRLRPVHGRRAVRPTTDLKPSADSALQAGHRSLRQVPVERELRPRRGMWHPQRVRKPGAVDVCHDDHRDDLGSSDHDLRDGRHVIRNLHTLFVVLDLFDFVDVGYLFVLFLRSRSLVQRRRGAINRWRAILRFTGSREAHGGARRIPPRLRVGYAARGARRGLRIGTR